MKRLYFLLPNLTITRNIVNQLDIEHIQHRDIHVLASDEIDTDGLPPATIWQRSDLLSGLERGLSIGGIAGAISGIIASIFPPVGLTLGGGTIILSSLIGAGIGAWVYGMIGIHSHNIKIQPYDAQLDNGEILLMVDTPNSRAQHVSELVYRLYPKAQDNDHHSQSPAFM